MAIISNGTTDITLEFADEILLPSLEKVNKRASGGNLKQQVGGERIQLGVKARVTPSLFRSVLDLLKDGSINYFYTPEDDYDLYTKVIKPIPVQIDNIGEEWDNRKVHYIKFDVRSISYI